MEEEYFEHGKQIPTTDMAIDRRLSLGHYLLARRFALTVVLSLIVGGASCAEVSLFKIIADSKSLGATPEHQHLPVWDNFSPDMRIEQLKISQPGNTTAFSWHGNNYTSLFDKGFLHELLDLQNAITEISVQYKGANITLQDICLAFGQPSNNNCTILSILNYYQNSHELLDKQVLDDYGFWILANYFDHLEYCARNPYSTNDTYLLDFPCRGTFGGPVFPATVMDQYTGDKYGTSKTLMISLLVTNYQDAVFNEPALAWESKFRQFMTEYVQTHTNMHIVVSTGTTGRVDG